MLKKLIGASNQYNRFSWQINFEGFIMSINARVGIKPIKSHAEANRISQHIFRIHGPVPGNSEVCILPILKPAAGTFSMKKTLSPKERRSLQKKCQYLKMVLKKMVEKPNFDSVVYSKAQNRLHDLERQLATSKLISSKRIFFIELVLSLTNFKPHPNMASGYGHASQYFIQQQFGDQVKIVALAVHLDQASLHAHVLLSIKEKAWSTVIDRIANPVFHAKRDQVLAEYAYLDSTDHSYVAKTIRYERDNKLRSLQREEKKPYFVLTQNWHKYMETNLAKQGVLLKPLHRYTSKSYVELAYFKDATAKLRQEESDVAILKDQYYKLLEDLNIVVNMGNHAKTIAKKSEELSHEIAEREENVDCLTKQLLAVKNHKKVLEDELLKTKKGEQDDEDEELDEIRRIFRK